MNESMKKLTAALQELAESSTHSERVPLPDTLKTSDLILSKEIDDFVQMTREYAELTRNVSVGSY